MSETLRSLTLSALNNMIQSGTATLPVDAEARGILRDWMLASRQGESVHAAIAAPVPLPSQPLPPAPQSVEEKLEYLKQRAATSKAIHRLGTLRETMVFSTGSPHAQLMLIGEAPGYDEERLREPFVGRAGQKLNQILAAAQLSRESVYISNICKFRPSMGPQQGSNNRPPSDAEIAASLPIIMAEIRAVRPACILCLGGTAAKALLGSASSVASLRGQWLSCQGVPLRVTYHPSYILRNDTNSAKRAVWEDFLAVLRQLNMPISPRQQNYFLS